MSAPYVFGEAAQWNARFYGKGDRPLLVVSGDGALEALAHAVGMREDGERFEIAFVLEEQRTVQARIFGPELLRFSQDFDRRRNAFELLDRGGLELNKRPQAELGHLSPAVARTLGDLACLADGFVVQTWREYRRVASLLGVRKPARRACVRDDRIPHVVPDETADAIVVWAPNEVPAALGAILFALEEVRRPSYVVAQTAPVYGLKTALVAPEDCERVLARAGVIIDASPHGPASTLTFLQRGFSVVTATGAGADEYVTRTRTYDPCSRRSIFSAVMAAIGDRVTPYEKQLEPVPAPSPATVLDRAPAVSLIVRTQDRLKLLARALKSAQAQTYPNLEAVVINDGGDSDAIGAVCANFNRVRVVTIERAGVANAANAGMAAARGKYAAFLDDDDELFPDHVERLAGALERSGALAAYSDALNIYLRSVLKNFAVTGYRAIRVPALEPTTMLSICQVVGACRMMFDRQWVVRSGPFNAQCAPADDYEMWLRIIEASDVVRIDAVTSLYSQFVGAQLNNSVSSGSKYADAHRLTYALHPTDRPAVRQRRNAYVETLSRRGGHGMFAPVVTLDPQPLLFSE